VRHLRLTTMGRAAIARAEEDALEARAAELGVVVGALYSARNSEWVVSVVAGQTRTRLRAHGPLAAILAGALDDFEAVA
jgi:hypothetical protein